MFAEDHKKGGTMLHEELTHSIIGAGMEVLSVLKPGLDEKIYERAMAVELGIRGLAINQQRQFPVQYKGHAVGILIPDFIVESKVVVDPKVVSEFNESHIAQMLGYLAITDLEVALLLNFKHSKLTWQRVVKSVTK